MRAVGDEKQCSRCKRWRPLDDFVKGQSFSDGLNPWCKDCRKEYHKEYGRDYRAKNSERISERLKRYYEENRERVGEKKRLRRESEEVRQGERERSRRNYLEHKEEYRERTYKWRHENPEKEREHKRVYRERHKEGIKKYRSCFRREHPEKDLAYGARRRMLIGAKMDNEIDIKRIYKRDRDICYLCGKKVKKSERHLDHVIPLSRGGAHSEENLRVTHGRCNLIKGAKLVEELDMSRFK